MNLKVNVEIESEVDRGDDLYMTLYNDGEIEVYNLEGCGMESVGAIFSAANARALYEAMRRNYEGAEDEA